MNMAWLVASRTERIRSNILQCQVFNLNEIYNYIFATKIQHQCVFPHY